MVLIIYRITGYFRRSFIFESFEGHHSYKNKTLRIKTTVDLQSYTEDLVLGAMRQESGVYDKSGEIVVSSLPSKKRWRPLLLGDELDKQVQSYVRATTVSISTRVVTILIVKRQVRRADVHGACKIVHVKIFSNSATDSKIKTSKFNLSRVLQKFLLQK